MIENNGMKLMVTMPLERKPVMFLLFAQWMNVGDKNNTNETKNGNHSNEMIFALNAVNWAKSALNEHVHIQTSFLVSEIEMH